MKSEATQSEPFPADARDCVRERNSRRELPSDVHDAAPLLAVGHAEQVSASRSREARVELVRLVALARGRRWAAEKPAVAVLEVLRVCAALGQPQLRRVRVVSVSGVQSRRAVRREGLGEPRVDRVSRVREAKRGPVCIVFISKRKEVLILTNRIRARSRRCKMSRRLSTCRHSLTMAA